MTGDGLSISYGDRPHLWSMSASFIILLLLLALLVAGVAIMLLVLGLALAAVLSGDAATQASSSVLRGSRAHSARWRALPDES
jgi:hypothetical protein